MSSVEAFFLYARERQSIKLRRDSSTPGPWTDDPILQQYRFTNVFREDDRTTVWFRENVRSRYSGADLLLATVIFRWFNRITTGEAIFTQSMFDEGTMVVPPFDAVQNIGTRGLDLVRQSILSYCGSGPYVTGAYIIKTPDGYNKLDGVLKCIEWFMKSKNPITEYRYDYKEIAELCEETDRNGCAMSLEQIWSWLRYSRFLGDFMAYEIVTDLRHTPLLSNAPDIMTWANPGPGATRGLGRVMYGDKDYWNQHRDKQELILMMQGLLEQSKSPQYWPADWPKWEMRDVEHTLCEFDKYQRVLTGEGRPRGRFR